MTVENLLRKELTAALEHSQRLAEHIRLSLDDSLEMARKSRDIYAEHVHFITTTADNVAKANDIE